MAHAERDGVLDLLAQLSGDRTLASARQEESIIVYAVQVLDSFLQFRREAEVAGVAVGEERVTSEGWRFHTVGDGAQGWSFHPCHVGVPAVFAAGAAFAVHDLEDERIGPWLPEREGVEFTERPSERRLLGFGEVLVTEEDHLAFEQGVADEACQLRCRWLGEVDAA